MSCLSCRSVSHLPSKVVGINLLIFSECRTSASLSYCMTFLLPAWLSAPVKDSLTKKNFKKNITNVFIVVMLYYTVRHWRLQQHNFWIDDELTCQSSIIIIFSLSASLLICISICSKSFKPQISSRVFISSQRPLNTTTFLTAETRNHVEESCRVVG